MQSPLIVGIDDSEPSWHALDWAIAEAGYHEVPLRLVHVSESYQGGMPPDPGKVPPPEVLAERVISTATRRVAESGSTVEVSTLKVSGDPVQALRHEGESAFAIVVGTRGRGGVTGMLLGSTSLGVTAHAKCPVIVVRGGAQNIRGEFSRVTLGVGVGGESSAATAFALREADVRGAELYALHAWHRPARDLPGVQRMNGDSSDPEEQSAERTLGDALAGASRNHPGVLVRQETAEGHTRSALLDASAASDLLVVGAHRRHGAVGLQLGLVSHALVHHSTCPVAVVPEG
ncbi:universal stress protein [Streptomyces sp. NPDC049040]|uniref:universal stress protein n=1 Tax=Streptomyces sp. NPDC049040 TaxID=3365593 RepID=UPI0037160F54